MGSAESTDCQGSRGVRRRLSRPRWSENLLLMVSIRAHTIIVVVTLLSPYTLARGSAQVPSERCDPQLLPERDPVVFSVPPRLLNSSAARRLVAAAHPRSLRRAGVGGTAWVAVLILEDGRMAAARLTGSSGHATLDSAAVGVARNLKFAPPYVGAAPTCGWFEFSIRFPAPARDSAASAQPPEGGHHEEQNVDGAGLLSVGGEPGLCRHRDG